MAHNLSKDTSDFSSIGTMPVLWESKNAPRNYVEIPVSDVLVRWHAEAVAGEPQLTEQGRPAVDGHSSRAEQQHTIEELVQAVPRLVDHGDDVHAGACHAAQRTQRVH